MRHHTLMSAGKFSPMGRCPEPVEGQRGLSANGRNSAQKYNSESLRSLLTNFLNHKEKMVNHLGYSTHKMGQLKAIATIKLRLAHVPYHDTQRMLNLYHSVRLELGELLPGTHSRFQRQRDQIESVLEYASTHNTVNHHLYA